MMSITGLSEWQALGAHRNALAPSHQNRLFAEDPQRFDRLCFRCDAWLADFSKQRLTTETLDLLLRFAAARNLTGFMQRMAAGEAVNVSEQRAARHIALRAREVCTVADQNVFPEISATRARLRTLSEAIRTGAWRGAGGQPVTAIVNLGIGGSDLGPRMVTQALAANALPALQIRFVANLDPAEFTDAVRGLDPARTLFIVSSKSFTTQETLANARAARAWLGGADPARHFIAISNNLAAAQGFGIPAENCLAIPEWVGGRFSLWSAIGLPIACAIGMEAFEALLAGAREMDTHFLTAPLRENLPVLMALVGLWNINFLGAQTLAILPYAHRLGLLPAYLQQLEMESNGKCVTRAGETLDYDTAPIVWGMAGTIGQHAFHQFFYQGSHLTPIDFIVPVGGDDPAQQALVAHALAQSAALMQGKTREAAHAQLIAAGSSPAAAKRLASHLACPGGQPSTTLLLPALTPRTLGGLLALYEHKVAVQGHLWDINSFDQWGVEQGKQMAHRILSQTSATTPDLDASTAGLLKAIHTLRKS